MAILYEECGEDEYAMLAELIGEYRADLAAAHATIKLYFATSDKPGTPAIKHRGQRVLGSAKPHGYKDRVQGKPDASIILDGDDWKLRSELQRRALLHHELKHLATTGKEDGLGRPVLKSRDADWETDGFAELVKLYGDDSVERRVLGAIEQTLAQLDLPMGDGGHPDPPEIVGVGPLGEAVAEMVNARSRRRPKAAEARP